jgi:O-antigen polymerase
LILISLSKLNQNKEVPESLVALHEKLFHGLRARFNPAFRNMETAKTVEVTKYLALVSVLLMMVILPALQSRASWIAVVAATGFVLYKKFDVQALLKNHLNSRAKKAAGMFLLAILLAGFSFAMYHFKKDSADGRVLIWKVTAKMIGENPVTGMGHEKFKSRYMDGQAAYFANNPGSEFEMVADENVYAYNDFLKVASENGLVGLLLVLLILFQALFAKTGKIPSPIVFSTRAGIISLLAFSLFSYPSGILPIKLNFVFLLAMLAGSARQVKTLVYHRKYRLLPVLGIVVLASLSVPLFYKMHQSYKYWKGANTAYHWELYHDALEEFEAACPMLKSNGMFLINYGKALSMAGKHEQAIEVLKGAQDCLTNTVLYTAMGDSYRALSEYQKAEQAYKHALDMIPSRFYPSYLLANLYDEWGKKDKVISVACELLEKEVKVESTAIEEIKAEMKALINKWQ